MVKQMKKDFLDLLKILQLALIFVRFLGRSVVNLMDFSKQGIYTNSIWIVIENVNGSLVFFYVLNQLTWHILIEHLKSYREYINGESYRKWRKKVKWRETISLIAILVAYILIVGNWSIVWYLSYKNDDKSFLNVIYCERIAIEIILALNEIQQNNLLSCCIYLHPSFTNNEENTELLL